MERSFALVKPQFRSRRESHRKEASSAIRPFHRRVLRSSLGFLRERTSMTLAGCTFSSDPGPSGISSSCSTSSDRRFHPPGNPLSLHCGRSAPYSFILRRRGGAHPCRLWEFSLTHRNPGHTEGATYHGVGKKQGHSVPSSAARGIRSRASKAYPTTSWRTNVSVRSPPVHVKGRAEGIVIGGDGTFLRAGR